jgi:hypothetical protein
MEKLTLNMYTHTCTHTSSHTVSKKKTKIKISSLSDLNGEVYQTIKKILANPSIFRM